MDFTIRPISLDDIPAVVQIEQASRADAWSKQLFLSELKNSSSRPLVLLESETSSIIGYIFPWFVADEIQIQNIVVAQAYRGQSLGSLLLNIALANGLEAGCIQAILEVRESNRPAINLYHQYQFGIVGRRESYYRDGETALLMTAGPFNTRSDLAEYREFISKQASRLKDQLQFQVE